MSLSLPNLIVRSALRQYLREERLMEDAEIGLMLAAAWTPSMQVNWMAMSGAAACWTMATALL